MVAPCEPKICGESTYTKYPILITESAMMQNVMNTLSFGVIDHDGVTDDVFTP